MSLPVESGLPDGMELPPNYTFRWRAVDPTSGADVAGVVISDTSIFGTPQGVGPIGQDAFKPVLISAPAPGGG